MDRLGESATRWLGPRRRLTVCLTAAVALAACVGGGSGAADGRHLADAGWPTVEIVPVGNLPASLVVSIATGLRYHVNVRVGPRVALPHAVDAQKQPYAEDVIRLVTRSVKGRVPANAILISITTHDLRARALPKARFVFTTRIRPTSAVISTARIDGRADGIPREPEIMRQRLQKLVIRDLFVLAFNQPLEVSPRSVLYQGLSSTDDLDQMHGESNVTGKDINWQWASSVGAACTRATAALNTPAIRRARRQVKTIRQAGSLIREDAAVESALLRRLVTAPAVSPSFGPAQFVAAARNAVTAESSLADAYEKNEPQLTLRAKSVSFFQAIVRAHIYADEAYTRACALHYALNVYRR